MFLPSPQGTIQAALIHPAHRGSKQNVPAQVGLTLGSVTWMGPPPASSHLSKPSLNVGFGSRPNQSAPGQADTALRQAPSSSVYVCSPRQVSISLFACCSSYPNELGPKHWTNERYENLMKLKQEALSFAREQWADYILVRAWKLNQVGPFLAARPGEPDQFGKLEMRKSSWFVLLGQDNMPVSS